MDISEGTGMIDFSNDAAEFVYVRTYARWMDEEGRREAWDETTKRYTDFLHKHMGDKVPTKTYDKIQSSILSFDVMPSMRALWAAGPAAEKDNTCMYNCSFQVVDDPIAFSEALYILMCGTGYGFSVESKYTDKLPVVGTFRDGAYTKQYTIEDSKRGWTKSVKLLIDSLYEGHDVDMDYSEIRPKGSRLYTMGGRSSGPEPLIQLHGFIREVFQNAQGRKLTPLECHDVMNQIAEIVVVGGVRRSSQISLSDLTDTEMAQAKVWPFPLRRAMANNSAVYTTQPTATEFLGEWSTLAASGTGERGMFNLESSKKRAPRRRDGTLIAGTNPCAEISLRNQEFCNLSEVVVRAQDDLDTLFKKVETAVWIGAIQSCFTHFPYLNDNWKKNCEEERLLGVSLTGIMDNEKLLSGDALKALKRKAIKTGLHAAEMLNINMPAAITCVKPSGTVSQLVNSSSGIHARYAKHYMRRYRIATTDPLLRMLKDQKVKMSPENGQRQEDWNKAKNGDAQACSIYKEGEEWDAKNVRTWVVTFPVKSPDDSIFREELSAIDQLTQYKKIQNNWCEHNASCTVYVKEDEWFEVGNWVYKNWKILNGVSFLPYDGGRYEQAPYEECTKEKYEELLAKLPMIDYRYLGMYEKDDSTEGAQTWACSGDRCELT
jgi:ribonucleoside-triphosphate reductase (thioredoxin)